MGRCPRRPRRRDRNTGAIGQTRNLADGAAAAGDGVADGVDAGARYAAPERRASDPGATATGEALRSLRAASRHQW